MDVTPLRKDLERKAEQTASGREAVQERAKKALVMMSAEEQKQVKYLIRCRKPA